MTEASLVELLSLVDHGVRADEGSFKVISIPGYQKHYVGRSSAGHPALLLGSETGAFHAPVRLALLEVRYGCPHRIHLLEGEEREQLLSVIVCTSDDRQKQEYFLHVCETLLRIVGPNPSLVSVVNSVQRLIELFRHLAHLPSRTLNGLLGELFVISASRDARAAVAAWRTNDTDRFDFSTANVRVDVKASADRLRVHHLSLEQCHPPAGTVGLLASVFIESSGGGLSLRELIGRVEIALKGEDDLILKLHETVAIALGESSSTAMGARFDEKLAAASLSFYDMSSVPAIRGNIPPEVSQVRFSADLSRTAPLVKRDVETLPELAACFLPK